MCCGDGVLLTFLAVMRCLLILFAVLRCSDPPTPHVLLLENGRNSKTSTTIESSADVEVEISSVGFTRYGFKKYPENEEA